MHIAVHSHSFDTSSSTTSLLRSLLPNSLPLLSRIHFPANTPKACVLATFPTETTPNTLPERWAIGFFDRGLKSGTQALLFSSFELNPSLDAHASDGREHLKHVLALLSKLDAISPISKANDLNRQSHSENADFTASDLKRFAPSDVSVFKYALHTGHLHVRLGNALATLDGSQSLIPHDIARAGLYGKYIFSIPIQPTTKIPTNLPDGLFFDIVREQDYPAVLATSSIVKVAASLVPLPCLGARRRDDGKLVAWVFLKSSSEIGTLYVEDEYRGMKLGSILVKKICDEQIADMFGLNGESFGFGHADIEDGNNASVRLFEGFGARKEWECYWLRVVPSGAETVLKTLS